MSHVCHNFDARLTNNVKRFGETFLGIESFRYKYITLSSFYEAMGSWSPPTTRRPHEVSKASSITSLASSRSECSFRIFLCARRSQRVISISEAFLQNQYCHLTRLSLQHHPHLPLRLHPHLHPPLHPLLFCFFSFFIFNAIDPFII